MCGVFWFGLGFFLTGEGNGGLVCVALGFSRGGINVGRSVGREGVRQ